MTTPVDSGGQDLAVKAETLYIINLMLAPGLGFLLLALLWRKHRHDAPPLARNHLAQTFIVSLWGAVGGLAAAVGPSAGSFVIDQFGWPCRSLRHLPAHLLPPSTKGRFRTLLGSEKSLSHLLAPETVRKRRFAVPTRAESTSHRSVHSADVRN